jgi:electron transfer flavoprotein beta subunit
VRIAVCVAAVPHPDKVKWDRFRQLLDVQDAEPVLNPADRLALELAALLAKAADATFDAYSAGAGASAALREAAAFGAQRLVAVSDAALERADEAGIAAALAAAISKSGGADAIVCGAATASNGSGAVPGYLSAFADAGLRAGVISAQPSGDLLDVTAIDGPALIRTTTAVPVVLAAAPYGINARTLSPILLMRASKKPIEELSLADAGAPTPLPTSGALDGPLESNRKKRANEVIEGSDAQTRAITLVAALRERQLI